MGWMIQAEDVRKTYRIGKVDVPALRGVSLEVEKGGRNHERDRDGDRGSYKEVARIQKRGGQENQAEEVAEVLSSHDAGGLHRRGSRCGTGPEP